jgi:serine/threonine protein phosphatase 1
MSGKAQNSESIKDASAAIGVVAGGRRNLPEQTRIYAVGDVHGRADLLTELFQRIDEHRAGNPIGTSIEVLLGDYVDRGPSSRQVIDLLICRKTTHSAVCLRGNHEAMLLEFMRNPMVNKNWFNLGGASTLLSYGIAPPRQLSGVALEALPATLFAAMPPTHLEFLQGLPYSFTCGDYFFVHAGVRPNIAISSQDPHDMMWIREDFLASQVDFGKIVVHGHTPVMKPEILSNRINIDTGAYATGKLTCLVIDDIGVRVLG